MQDHVQLPIREIGRWLEWRRSNNSQTVLLLGSRAGALYRSKTFYSYCQQYVAPNFSTRPLLWSFRECYKVLVHNQLGERELHALLQDSLKNVGTLHNIHDVYCAEIVKRGYFREVVSTNIDDIVERAMVRVELIEGKDFKVFIPDEQSLTPQRDLPYRLTKVFGDVLSRQYAIYNRQAYLTHEKLDQYLQNILSGDVLAIGLDPLWDRSIFPFLYDLPHSLWFVNEEEDIVFDQQIAPILSQTKSAAVIHQDHDYDTFWHLLYQQLCKNNDLQENFRRSWRFSSQKEAEADIDIDNLLFTERSVSSDSSSPQNENAIPVLYIYCDDDLPLMQKIWQHLQTLKNNNLIREWHRGHLVPGDHFQLKQERALRQARLIFVGFSAQFLASEYSEQALQALKLSYEGVVTLVPLLLRPVGNWKQTPFSAIYALPREDKTLSELSSKDLDRELSKIAKDINDLVLRLKKR
jgi:hypothetical protein